MTEPQPNEPQPAHGGARPGAGRKPKGKSYKAAAGAVRANVERGAIAAGGNEWAMLPEEAAAIDTALAEIFERWELDGIDNPYAALIIASAMYCFAPGRLPPKTVWTKMRDFYAARRGNQKAAAAAGDEIAPPPEDAAAAH